jgi:hypothetical protein
VRSALSLVGTLLACVALAASAAVPNTPKSAKELEAERDQALAAAGLEYAGDWYTTEVIVFERPQVDPAQQHERLLVDGPRAFPARLRTLDTFQAGSRIYYSRDSADPSCGYARPGAASSGNGRADGGMPAALTRPLTPPPEEPQAPEQLPDAAAAAADAAAVAADAAAAPAPPPDPLADLRSLVTKREEELVEQSLAWLPPERRTLAREAQRLSGSGYRVLFHDGWVQDLAADPRPPAMLVQPATPLPGGGEISGTLRFGYGGQPRFDADLWYVPDGPIEPPNAYVALDERRGLADGELHYLDHPKLGVLVRTTRVRLPQEVLDGFAALSAVPAPAPAATSGAGPGAAAPSNPLPPR